MFPVLKKTTKKTKQMSTQTYVHTKYNIYSNKKYMRVVNLPKVFLNFYSPQCFCVFYFW